MLVREAGAGLGWPVRSRVTSATAGDFAFRWVCTCRSRGLPDELEAGAAVGPRQTVGLRVAAVRIGGWDDGVAHVDAGGMASRCACAVKLPGRHDGMETGFVVGPRQIAGLRVATLGATKRDGGAAKVTTLRYTCS